MRYTPDIISELQPNEIFVFGSNQFASHGAGSAKIALKSFGAVMDTAPMGLIGKSYGIITTSFTHVPITIDFIFDQIKCLYVFATLRPDLTFYVTKIATGIAGFSIEIIANLFHSLEDKRPSNIILPKEFSKN